MSRRRPGAKCFLVVAALASGCGGAAAESTTTTTAPGQTNSSTSATDARAAIEGCWRVTEILAGSAQDAGVGSAFCLDASGIAIILADGRWNRFVVAWRVEPSRWIGDLPGRPPRATSVTMQGATLLVDDGLTRARLSRPESADAAELQRRFAALPTVEAVCARAEQCRVEASRVIGEELDRADQDMRSARNCIGLVDGARALIERSNKPAVTACAPLE